jgi:glutamyl-Q tRNA(Asp) synthetase
MAGEDPSGPAPGGAYAPRSYVGRFAPSPTGSLHLGSLVAAVGSFVDARADGGRWLLRIEDLDTTRVLPGCSDEILRTLEAFGLRWDGEVEYQSRRIDHYLHALQTLRAAGVTFECSCSRRELANTVDTGYPGTCRNGPTRRGPTATRFRVDDSAGVLFHDRVQGPCRLDLKSLGDVVIRRRDGVFAYQLAVVVDDAEQGVTDIIRGADLLESTGWQIALQRSLRLPSPRYGHLPLVVEPTRGKLAKTRRSVALDPGQASAQLMLALGLLQHLPPAEFERETPSVVLEWACANWNLDSFHGVREVRVPAAMLRV